MFKKKKNTKRLWLEFWQRLFTPNLHLKSMSWQFHCISFMLMNTKFSQILLENDSWQNAQVLAAFLLHYTGYHENF